MTPYELRFSIYQEARQILESEYQYKHDRLRIYLSQPDYSNQNKPSDMNPQFPTPEKIEELARKIYNFVETKQA